MGLLELIIVILVIAWVLGSFVVPVGGSLINLLLVVVVIVVLIRVLQGRSL
ncbi:MAG TPA: lmo0937 family membrane protein [Gemmatimonadaceae bacterium]|nr:lmo0937 family membrane protein [Gemmatimonadaceae bacterium]